MPTTNFTTTTQDGYITAAAGVAAAADNTGVNLFVDVSSSSATVEHQSLWFCDTSALGATAIIDAATWNMYCNTATEDGISSILVYVDKLAAAGATLSTADYNVGKNYNILNTPTLGTGWITTTVPTTEINKTGYTNVIAIASASSVTSAGWIFDSFNNASGRAGYFAVTYHYPGGGSTLALMGVG